MEEEDNHDGTYKNEEWLTDEPGGKKYKITRIVNCRAQDEWELEEALGRQPVAVGGVIYEPSEWNDPGWRTLKTTIPP